MSDGDAPVMLVTGATGSIGGAVARDALAKGWRVVLHGRDAARLAALADEIDPDGNATVRMCIDLSEEDAATRLVAEAGAMAGRIDAVVDCVSMGAPRTVGTFDATQPERYTEMLALSLGHVERLAHAALPLLSAKGGTFVALASDAGRHAAPNQSIIGAARAGTIGFVRNLAVEVARKGVRVHCICATFVADSESARRLSGHARDRLRKAEAKAGLGLPTCRDVSVLALFLCSDEAARMTGQILSVNGGLNA